MGNAVIQRIATTCEHLGELDLGGVKLETAEPGLLDVRHIDLDTHVAIQPSAIAYYGSLKKEASRRLASLHRDYDRWTKKKYAEAKASLVSGTGKTTVADIESQFIINNENEIIRREDQIEKAQFEFDTLDVWFEAWRQKSFSIREHAEVEETERQNQNTFLGQKEDGSKDKPQRHSLAAESSESSISRIRSLLRNRTQGKSNSG